MYFNHVHMGFFEGHDREYDFFFVLRFFKKFQKVSKFFNIFYKIQTQFTAVYTEM